MKNNFKMKSFYCSMSYLGFASLVLLNCAVDDPIDSSNAQNDKAQDTRSDSSISWEHNGLRLTATSFSMDIDGKTYTAVADDLDVNGNGDPGFAPIADSLELQWTEHDAEMRLYIYLDSDENGDWYSNEIRTYDGTHGDDGSLWLYYEGDFFRSNTSTPFIADEMEIHSTSSDNLGKTGVIRFEGLNFEGL